MEDENKEIEKNETKKIKSDKPNPNNKGNDVIWIWPALISLWALTLSLFFIANNIGFISLVVSLIASVTGLVKYSKNSNVSQAIFIVLICIVCSFIMFNLSLMVLLSYIDSCTSPQGEISNTLSSCE